MWALPQLTGYKMASTVQEYFDHWQSNEGLRFQKPDESPQSMFHVFKVRSEEVTNIVRTPFVGAPSICTLRYLVLQYTSIRGTPLRPPTYRYYDIRATVPGTQ